MHQLGCEMVSQILSCPSDGRVYKTLATERVEPQVNALGSCASAPFTGKRIESADALCDEHW